MDYSDFQTMSFEKIEARARQLERDQQLDEARKAYDAALRLNPSSTSCIDGRARIALRLRQPDAAELCAQSLALREGDPKLQEQMLEVAAPSLEANAIPLLKAHIERHPLSVSLHELLASLRSQSGAGDEFADSFLTAIERHPDHKPLLMAYWNTLARAGRQQQALDSIDTNRDRFAGDREVRMMEISIAGHCGQTDRAGKLLEGMDLLPDAQLARGLNRLQTGRPDEAATALAGVVINQPDNLEAWSMLELAWRIIGDTRHQWLVGDPPLYGSLELELSASELSEIAAALRTMHTARSQPLGQSVRGGTQTSGQLFVRDEPEIALLAEALGVAIRGFVDGLPDADPRHPLLKHRDMGMAFGPSWSVRFTGSGHHAAHFHPGGILSSACYIAVPDTLAGSQEQEGWLEIGRPPPELGLDLPPLATFEPTPGRLVLFPSFLFHGTRPFSGGERMSVAFDLVPVPPS